MAQTAMQAALLKAGAVSVAQVAKVKVVVPHNLKQYAAQIERIVEITTLLKERNAPFTFMDWAQTLLFESQLQTRQYSDTYKMMLDHLEKKLASLKQ